MLLLSEGEGLIMVSGLIIESSPWHVFLLITTFCFISSAIIVSIKFMSVFKASDFIICSYIASMSGRLFSYFVYCCKNFWFEMLKNNWRGFTITFTVRRDCKFFEGNAYIFFSSFKCHFEMFGVCNEII